MGTGNKRAGREQILREKFTFYKYDKDNNPWCNIFFSFLCLRKKFGPEQVGLDDVIHTFPDQISALRSGVNVFLQFGVVQRMCFTTVSFEIF